jgi:hypothetical protein
LTALPITSAGRFSPLGPVGIYPLRPETDFFVKWINHQSPILIFGV